MKGSVGVAVTIGRVQPASDHLSGRTRVPPSLRRLPVQGFGAAVAFNWFDAEIDERRSIRADSVVLDVGVVVSLF